MDEKGRGRKEKEMEGKGWKREEEMDCGERREGNGEQKRKLEERCNKKGSVRKEKEGKE